MQDCGRPTPIDLSTELCCLLCLSFPISRMGTINPMAGGRKGDFYLTAAASAWSRVCVGGQWVTPPCFYKVPLNCDPHVLLSLPAQGPLCALHLGDSHSCALRLRALGSHSPLPTPLVHPHPPTTHLPPSAQTITQQIPGLIAFHL